MYLFIIYIYIAPHVPDYEFKTSYIYLRPYFLTFQELQKPYMW